MLTDPFYLSLKQIANMNFIQISELIDYHNSIMKKKAEKRSSILKQFKKPTAVLDILKLVE